jgi:hypothetical protein
MVGSKCHRAAFRDNLHNAYDAGAVLKRWYNSVMARGEWSSRFRSSSPIMPHSLWIGPDRLRTIPAGSVRHL